MTINGFGMKQKLILSLMLYVAFSFNAYAQVGTTFDVKDINGNKLKFKIISSSKVKMIRSFSLEKATKVNIPGKVKYRNNEYEVSELEEGLFIDCDKLKEVQVPNNIKELKGKGHFMYRGGEQKGYVEGFFHCCRSLEKVLLPSSIQVLGESCFSGCSSLKEITIPSKVRVLERDIFAFCSSLEKVIFTGPVFKFEKSCFEYCSSLKKITFPSQTKVIGEEAFIECTSLEVVIFPEGLYEIGKSAFKKCTSLSYVILPNSVKNNVGNFAFQECSSLQYAIISDDFQNGFAFSDCISLTHVKRQNGSVPDYAIFDPSPFSMNKGKMENIDFDKELLGASSFMDVPVAEVPTPQVTIGVDITIDQNIPTNPSSNGMTFAFIIGNEKYQRVAAVPFASNDARIFAEYWKRILGLPEKNVKVYENATYGTMIGAVSEIQKIARAFKGDINVIFYYAGHGIPNEATGDGYLLPIDADGLNMRVCYPLSQLYKDLGEMQAKSVTCFMDACFSGAQRGNGMVVAARGVAIKAKADHPTGKTVVFTAATDKQTAYPYEEKGHGMFTYYLLKKLRETKGDCTLGELGTYISDEVAKQAVVTNGKEQTPIVLTSAGVAENWKTMKLK